MKVEIVNHSQNFTLLDIYKYGRRCTSDETEYENLYPAEIKDHHYYENFMFNLLSRKHYSVIEHLSITYSITGVSRTLLAQLTRHRVGFSYSVMSQRYVKTEKIEDRSLIVPPTIKNNPKAYEAFKSHVDNINETLKIFSECGIPQEDKRFIFPEGFETKLIMTVNLRSLLDFYFKRTEPGAQWEIKELAKELLDGVNLINDKIYSVLVKHIKSIRKDH